MSEEEIINKWFEKNMCVSFKKFTENWEEQQELTNYLQQENSQLKQKLAILSVKPAIQTTEEKLNYRIDKALEHIDSLFNNGGRVTINDLKEIREILKGDK